MKRVSYLISIILSLQFLSACGPGSPPTLNNPSYSVNILVDPVEGGTVLPEPGEIAEGDSIIISASPSEGWVFESWQGDHEGNINPDTVFMDGDKEITALFLERDYPLTVNIEGEGTVEERIVQPKTTDYPHGTVVELTAESAEKWSFVEWRGETLNDKNPLQITVDTEKEVTAVFEEILFTVRLETEGNGTVNVVLLSGNETDDFYEINSVVELTAVAEDGWQFLEWDEDLSETQNPQSLTIDTNKVVKAVFVQHNTDFEGGSGTELNPYRISTIEQLQNIEDEKYIDKHFIQINNINAVATSNWNRGQGFNPIGSESSPFNGSYDGDGYEISRLSISRGDGDNVGLFGFVMNGSIKNTGLRNAGISGDEIVGGLVGNNNGDVIRSYVYGSVAGEEKVGGLVGRNNGRITESYVSVDVTGEEEVGGLVGQNHQEVYGSYSEGSVSADDDRIGGLAGYNTGSISHSYSHSEVTGDENVGGLVGENRSNGTVEYSYATGRVTGDEQLGGLIGTNRANITDSYWDTEGTDQRRASGRGSSRGSTGLRTSEMNGSSAMNNMPEFDWDEIWRITSEYPNFRWQEP